MEHRIYQAGEVLSVVDEANRLILLGYADTNVGQVRSNNEDSVQLWAFAGGMLGLVADGMGGAAGGEEASRLTVETFQSDFVEAMPAIDTLQRLPEDTLAEKLRYVIGRANRAVLNRAALDMNLQGMGTTATAALIRGRRVVLAHIGDSRAYIVSGETRMVKQLTHDHSFVEALVASGHITPEQAAIHPLKNVLYKALGQKDEAEEDVDIYDHAMHENDRLILCSDGLTRHLKDEDIAQIAFTSDSPIDIARNLVSKANERGGEDNISAVVMVMQGKPGADIDDDETTQIEVIPQAEASNGETQGKTSV